MTTGYIKQLMTERLRQLGFRSRIKLRRGWSSKATYGPAWVGIREMSYLGLLVNAGRKGPESLWMRTADWLKAGKRVPDPEDCVTELVRKFIARYGPVSRSDIISWSMLSPYEVAESIEALRKDLVEEHLEDSNERYYSFGGAHENWSEPPKAIILPEFDSLMMGYNDKSRFLPFPKASVFRPLGIVSPTVLVDGFVAATWRGKKEKAGTTISVMPMRELNTIEGRSIQEKFAAYGDYLGTRISVVFRRPS